MEEEEEDATLRQLRWGLRDDLNLGSSEGESAASGSETDSSSDGEDLGAARVAKGRRRTYTNRFKLETIEAVKAGGKPVAVARSRGIKCHSSVTAWIDNESKIRAACLNRKGSKVSLGGQGRVAKFKNEDELRQWIKDLRREDFPLKTSHVAQFLKEEYSAWTMAYLALSQESSLFRLIRRMIRRQGFAFRQPSRSILSIEELMQEQIEFTESTATGVAGTYPLGSIYNTDETGVYFDDAPGRIIAERGAKKSTKIKGKKQSYRATVLLTVAADGKKLPPLIIFKAQPGGSVEDSFDEYPEGALYAVQANAWMDASVWKESFIETLWEEHVCESEEGPTVLYVDNFKTHVSEASINAFAALGTELVPLPTNTTAILQPLDVGVMGPFKKKLRSVSMAAELELLIGQRTSGTPLRQRLLAIRTMPAELKRKAIAAKVIKAWDSMSEETIRRAWIKSKLIRE